MRKWTLKNPAEKLGGNRITRTDIPISPNKIAVQIVSTSRALRDKAHTTQIKHKNNEITVALKDLKTGKTLGLDGIHPDFLLNCGNYCKKWLAEFFTSCKQAQFYRI